MNDERGTRNDSAFQTNEGLRKFLHIVFGLGAVALKFINWRVAALAAAAATSAATLQLMNFSATAPSPKTMCRNFRSPSLVWNAESFLVPRSSFIVSTAYN